MHVKERYNMPKIVSEIILTILGSSIMALGVSLFLLPNQLSSGGVAGVATITYYLLKIPMGTMILLVNIPLFIIAFFKVGKSFFIKSLIGTVSLSYFIDIAASPLRFIKTSILQYYTPRQVHIPSEKSIYICNKFLRQIMHQIR